MMSPARLRRLMRWYPRSWRVRYEEEMVALLEDTYAELPVPLRSRVEIMRAGLGERLRSGMTAQLESTRTDRLRAGSLLVAAGWSFFLVAGAIFGKFTDGWNTTTRQPNRFARIGYDVVFAAGVAGVVVIIGAALIVTPAVLRFWRRPQWQTVRDSVRQAVVADVMLVAMTIGGVEWAHHLSFQARNGGVVAYQVFFLVWALSGVAAVGLSTLAGYALVRRLTLSDRIIATLSHGAIALTLIMVAVTGGVALWWGGEAVTSPDLLRNGIGNGIGFASGVLPPALVLAAALMLCGLSVASRGAWKLARERSRDERQNFA